MERMDNISDAEFSALIERGMERFIQKEKDQKMSKFSSTNDLLIFLANSSTKERENFLRPWKTESAKDGVGRKKKERDLDLVIASIINIQKEAYEHKTGKKISLHKFLIETFNRLFTNLSKAEADKKIKTLENIVTKQNILGKRAIKHALEAVKEK
jgi:hypothetical protein